MKVNPLNAFKMYKINEFVIVLSLKVYSSDQLILQCVCMLN